MTFGGYPCKITDMDTTVVLMQVEEGKRRAAEARAKLTQEQLATVVAAEGSFLDRIRRTVVTGFNDKGRVFLKTLTQEEFAEMFPEQA